MTKREIIIVIVTAVVTYIVIHISHINDKWNWTLTGKELEGIIIVLGSVGIIPLAQWRSAIKKERERRDEDN